MWKQGAKSVNFLPKPTSNNFPQSSHLSCSTVMSFPLMNMECQFGLQESQRLREKQWMLCSPNFSRGILAFQHSPPMTSPMLFVELSPWVKPFSKIPPNNWNQLTFQSPSLVINWIWSKTVFKRKTSLQNFPKKPKLSSRKWLNFHQIPFTEKDLLGRSMI